MELLEYLTEKKEELEKQINDISADFCDAYALNNSDYLWDLIRECANEHVLIYYSDLLEWFAGDGWQSVEDAIAEFGDVVRDRQGRPDIFATIREGQYIQNLQLLSQDIDSIKELLIINYLIKNLDDLKVIATTSEISDIISELVSDFEECERMDRVCDAINDKFSNKEGANND